MHRIIPFTSLVLLHLLACKPPAEEALPKPEPEIAPQAALDEAPLEDACINTSFQVFKETVLMWEQSWGETYAEGKESPEQTLFFSRENLDQLESLDEEGHGLRMYYGLADASQTTPVLALVNISDCKDQINEDEAPVLLSDDNGGHFVSICDAATMTAAWRDQFDPEDLSSVPVQAYNYNWPLIKELYEGEDGGLYITFGLRSTAPGETLFAPEAYAIRGAITYVNILHANEQVAASNHSFDFAMPCPQKCDEASPLSSDTPCETAAE